MNARRHGTTRPNMLMTRDRPWEATKNCDIGERQTATHTWNEWKKNAQSTQWPAHTVSPHWWLQYRGWTCGDDTARTDSSQTRPGNGSLQFCEVGHSTLTQYVANVSTRRMRAPHYLFTDGKTTSATEHYLFCHIFCACTDFTVELEISLVSEYNITTSFHIFFCHAHSQSGKTKKCNDTDATVGNDIHN